MKYLRLLPLLLVAACDGDGNASSETLPVAWVDAAVSYPTFGATRLAFSGSNTYGTFRNAGRSWLGRTSDAGQTWTTLDSTTSSDEGFFGLAADGNTLLIGADRFVRRSTDGGRTWTSQPLAPVQRAFTVSVSPLLAGGDSRFYRFDAATGTWRATGTETGYYVTDFLRAGNRIVATAGPAYTSDDEGVTWTLRRDTVRFVALAADENGTIYAAAESAYRADRTGLYRSTDRGTTWDLFAFEGTPISSVLAAGRTLIVGTSAFFGGAPLGDGQSTIWRSTDLGGTWTDVTGDLAPRLSDGFLLRVLERAPDGHVWVGTRSGLFRTTEPVAR